MGKMGVGRERGMSGRRRGNAILASFRSKVAFAVVRPT
ncbi:MAG: hypothetical protein OJF49_004064 [Ktedonobacterales bacterium]|nr:MAG: hypothetical protein OJF49_004064 [Ktedonobacterales bacterium]